MIQGWKWENWQVIKAEEEESTFRIHVRQPSSTTSCLFCAGRIVGIGKSNLTIRDLPLDGKPVMIFLTRQRYLCRVCGRTFRDAALGVDDYHRATRRFIAYVLGEDMQRTKVSLATELGCPESVVRLIIKHNQHRL